MTAMVTKSQTVMLLSSVLLGGCRFFPEQLLLPGQPETDQGAGGMAAPRSATMSSAVTAAGRPADSAAQKASMTGTPSMTSKASAAGSGAVGSTSPARMDAGADSMRTEMTMASAGAGGTAAAGGGGGGGGSEPEEKPKTAQDPTCDMTGVWTAKQVSVTEAIGEQSFINSWSFYEIEQSGNEFVVTNHIDCGGEGVANSGGATTSRQTLEALVKNNKQIGRKGHLSLRDGKCVLDIEHFWSVRGAEERFLPDDSPRSSTVTMSDLKKSKPLPTPSMPDGAVDFEGDGEPGAATQLMGIVAGVRNSCQRDWDHWFTAPKYEITPSMDFSDFTLRIEFETDESVMAPTSGLLTTATETAQDWDHIMRFRFLGRTTDDPRAQAIIKGDEVATCYAVQDSMPAEALMR